MCIRDRYSIDGVNQVPIEDIQSNPYNLITPMVGNYRLTAFNDAQCEGNIIGVAEVENNFIVETEFLPPSCFNSADGKIEIIRLEGAPPFIVEGNNERIEGLFIENLSEGIYDLRIIDDDGCLYEESFDLIARSNDFTECVSVFIPNSFSPNGDGINDVFSVYFEENGGVESIISFQVYNRWGALMFERSNFMPVNGDIGWQGNFNGEPLNPGVYVYKINIAFEDGTTLLRSGDVTLFR